MRCHGTVYVVPELAEVDHIPTLDISEEYDELLYIRLENLTYMLILWK